MTPTRLHRLIPWALVASRVLLAPVAVLVAASDLPRWIWLFQGTLAALSDIYDGVLARRWGVVTPGLRQGDSIADTIYAVAVGLSFFVAEPEIFWEHAWLIGVIMGIEAARYPLDWYRFGRGASYHALSARLFGVLLIPVCGAVMYFTWIGPFLWLVLLVGLYSEIEGVLMSLVLPRWTHDVPHLGVALAIRREAGG